MHTLIKALNIAMKSGLYLQLDNIQ